MKPYPLERKQAIQEKMLPPHNISISFLAKTEGVSRNTLRRWFKEALDSIIIQHPKKIKKQDKASTHKGKALPEKDSQELLQVIIKVKRNTKT
ncbi:hypothetical protein PSI19_04700 [Xenorhabdus khoisanae]|uniref:hypothetical protein n=1 Tax=Xenorhabdus khoisanae TaxID=880157 RepID=UPI002359E505|nr:hypothetical protein [Xenorhabdus khoisanae]MDC9613194.1 hypothetical protein [Xenorhabdus khoisanae]